MHTKRYRGGGGEKTQTQPSTDSTGPSPVITCKIQQNSGTSTKKTNTSTVLGHHTFGFSIHRTKTCTVLRMRMSTKLGTTTGRSPHSSTQIPVGKMAHATQTHVTWGLCDKKSIE